MVLISKKKIPPGSPFCTDTGVGEEGGRDRERVSSLSLRHRFAHTPGPELRVAGKACQGSSRGLTQPGPHTAGPSWPGGLGQY